MEKSPISRAGQGKQGYCKLCSFADEGALNDRIKFGWKSTQINNWLKTHYGFSVNRQTIYSHVKHVQDPADRVVTAVAKRQAQGNFLPRVASNEQYLEAIRDLGYQRAVASPEEVTIDHGLKAAQILASQKRSGGDIVILLAKIMSGGEQSFDIIEGQSVEVPA